MLVVLLKTLLQLLKLLVALLEQRNVLAKTSRSLLIKLDLTDDVGLNNENY